MKTTLKRGIGRAAELNGNGHAVYPPAIQPPMRRYRQPPPSRRSGLAWVGRIALWLLIAGLMVAGGIAGGTYLYVERDIAQGLEAKTFDVKVAQQTLDAVIPGASTTALVLGYDKRAGAEGAETGHSDTLMLVRADPQLETVTMLSFPRDLLVTVYGCKNRGTFVSRINDAYGECGSSASIETVRRLTGLPINFLVTVNFRGFKQVVSHLGGVWVDVDRRYFNDNSQGGERYATIDLKPGYQKLNGEKALDFVRYRHTDSDLYRLARQQQFVRSVKQRVADFSYLDLPQFVKVITSNVEVGKGDGTRFDAKTILDYALFAYQLPGGHVVQSKIDIGCYQGYAELTVAQSCVEDAVQQFMHPDVDAADKATDSALGRRRRSSVPSPSSTTVAVLNGNGQPGAAANAGSQLGGRGYRIVTGPDGNAPSFQHFRTEVYYQGTPAAEQAARRLAKLFGDTTVGPLPQDIAPLANGAMVTVVLGQTYHGSIPSSSADRTPKREPPQVMRDASAAPLLRDAVRRVPFQTYAPSVIDRSSRLDSSMPIHVYTLGDHNAIRLTYTNGLGDFWGIQETDWTKAPALRDPNDEIVVKGRRYALYYNGAHLHMVVLHVGDGTYWVVNTLLDKLSNETMLEIAKGLHPLARR